MTTTTRERRDEIGAFFAANAHRLHNAVRRTAHAPEQTIQRTNAAVVAAEQRPAVATAA